MIHRNLFAPPKFARLCSPRLTPPKGAGANANAIKLPMPSGLSIKRALLERAVQDDPNPEAFEEWLLDYPQKCATLESSGAVSAMARAVLEEWRLAHSLGEFRVWLEQGAPSDDAKDEKPRQRPSS